MRAQVHPVSVLQGQYRVSLDRSVVLTTILGSCVATCVWDPGAGVGGMNHFLLPGKATDKTGSLRYGVNAMELLVNGLLQKGARRDQLHAKIFGGASMFENDNGIGKKNVEFALWFAEVEGLTVVKQCVGGNLGRKIRFWPHNGDAQRKFLKDAWKEQPLEPTTSTLDKGVGPSGVLTLF